MPYFAIYGLAQQFTDLRWEISRCTVERLESGGMARKCSLFLALFRSVVRHRKASTRCSPGHLLVAQSRRFTFAVKLRPFSQWRFGFYPRLRLHLDSVHTQLDYSPATFRRGAGLSTVQENLPASFLLLFCLWNEIRGRAPARKSVFLTRRHTELLNHFFGMAEPGTAPPTAGALETMPYRIRIGTKSECVRP